MDKIRDDMKQTAEVIFDGGRVITQDEDMPEAQAVAAAGGRIIAVGSSAELEQLKTKNTVVYDMQGYWMLPGFIAADITKMPEWTRDEKHETAAVMTDVAEMTYQSGYTLVCGGNMSEAEKCLYKEALEGAENPNEEHIVKQRFIADVCDAGPYDAGDDPGDAADARTVRAAEKAGIADLYGTITVGKYADFAIFDEDPFRVTMVTSRLMPDVAAVVVGGKMVYDAEHDDSEMLYDMMTHQNY